MSKTTYGDGSDAFVYKHINGRSIPGEEDLYPVSGYTIEYTDQGTEYGYKTSRDTIIYMVNNSWADTQTRMLSVEANAVHCISGIFITHYVIYEFVVGGYTITRYVKYVAPYFHRSSQVILTICSVVSSLVLLGFSIIDLKISRKEYDKKVAERIENIKQGGNKKYEFKVHFLSESNFQNSFYRKKASSNDSNLQQ